MKKLKFDEWMARKGLTYSALFEQGMVSQSDLMEMVARLGVLPPDDSSEFDALILERQVVLKSAKSGPVQPKPQATEEEKPKPTRRRSTAAKSRTTRKKTNIKDTSE